MDTSSPPRPVLINKTNVKSQDVEATAEVFSPWDRKRQLGNTLEPARKRVKLQSEDDMDVDESEESELEDEEDDDDASFVSAPSRKWTAHHILRARMIGAPTSTSRIPTLSTRSILTSLVSSNKADVFKCESISEGSYFTPPYACSYSHGAKEGRNTLLAVATEQGQVHILNTCKRQEWDPEPQRCSFDAHVNAIFDVQWSPSDSLIATTSADKSISIVDLSSAEPTSVDQLSHHTSTVKCVTWDTKHGENVLCSGSRDGMICVWDRRVGKGVDGMKPVIVINKAHDTGKAPRKGKLTAPPARSVTSLIFSEHGENKLISSGSYDGILRQWDLRFLDMKRRRNSPPTRNITSPECVSDLDPTVYMGTRRARGLTSISPGTGPSAGRLFALSNDSRVHTYDAGSLRPLSGWTTEPSEDAWSYGHENMHTNSFYVRTSVSPCGRWLANGGAGGSVYLFDVSAQSRQAARRDPRGAGVELKGQSGEVGAVDWAEGMLATCADDGTVRIWRPDLQLYRKCQDEPEEMQWSWKWAISEQA